MSEEIIIRKRRGGNNGHGHHGGSWKIAFADFMTAMMALFLLLWLVSITTQEQREGIAMFFNPMAFKDEKSASDGMLAGKEIDTEGVDSSRFPKGDAKQPEAVAPLNKTVPEPGDAVERQKETAANNPAAAEAVPEEIPDQIEEKEQAPKPEEDFDVVMDEIKQKMSAAVDMEMLAESIIMEVTDEGLRIQITDRDKISMFPVGSTAMTSHASAIIKAIGDAVIDVPNRVAITGHTDGLAYKDASGYDNFDLSSGRANAARRILMATGIGSDRISRVEGLADKEHLVPENPTDPRNRRISVTLLRRF